MTGSSDRPPRRVRDTLPAVAGHQPALDGVRAVAALSVLVFHIASNAGAIRLSGAGWLFNGGQVGVALFFVLSGLLLYRPWARAVLEGRPAPRTGRYLRKRLVRILPAYAALVACFMVTAGRDHLADVWTWVKLLTLTFVYDPHRWWDTPLGPREIGQVWSLAVEVGWYLLLPATAAVLSWYALRAPAAEHDVDVDVRAVRLLRALGCYALISPAYTVLASVPRHHPQLSILLPRYVAWFAAGMALAVVADWARADRRPTAPVARFCRTVAASWGQCWLAAASLFVLAASPLAGPIDLTAAENAWTAQFHVLVFGSCAVFFVAPLALAPRGDRLTGVPSPVGLMGGRVMRFLGKISYSVFLWQLIIILGWYDVTGRLFKGELLVELPVLTVLVVLAGTLGHYLIEAPFLRFARPSPSSSPSASASRSSSVSASPAPSPSASTSPPAAPSAPPSAG